MKSEDIKVMDVNHEADSIKYPERVDDVRKLKEGDLAICGDGTIGLIDDIDLWFNAVVIRTVVSKSHEVGDYVLYQPWLSGISVESMYHLDEAFDIMFAKFLLQSFITK